MRSVELYASTSEKNGCGAYPTYSAQFIPVGVLISTNDTGSIQPGVKDGARSRGEANAIVFTANMNAC